MARKDTEAAKSYEKLSVPEKKKARRKWIKAQLETTLMGKH